jgi:hypothetical protein
MMRRSLLAILIIASACGGRDPIYSQPLTPLPLLATDSALVQVIPQTARAVRLRPGESPLPIKLSPGARVAARVPGSEQLAVLGGTLKAPRLDLVDVQSGAAVALEIPGLFDALHFSPDGKLVLLTHSPEAKSTPLAARNLNETALVDLASHAVSRIQLETESLAPRQVVFGPEEPDRRLVAVAFERGVAIFDALHPDRPARRIPIRPAGSVEETSVREAIFSSDGQ